MSKQEKVRSLLYIGQYTDGTTSKMRAGQLLQILKPEYSEILDTNIPFFNTGKVYRSLGFRYKRGPLISSINKYIQETLKRSSYDLIWVDKGVYLNTKTTRLLRQSTTRLIHFTPDPAFTFHRSSLFNESLQYYDYVITTKSFELDIYRNRISNNKILYATQGYDKELHKKFDRNFSEKSGLVFLGHHEKEREYIIKALLDHNIEVTLAGINWESFAARYKNFKLLNYLGKGVYGLEYVKTLQNAKIAWGAISKWVPELHTTRTFEIPACGTALLTEHNKETSKFFRNDEAIFYNDPDELLQKVQYFINHDQELESLTNRGYAKVSKGGYDYYTILSRLLNEILKV